MNVTKTKKGNRVRLNIWIGEKICNSIKKIADKENRSINWMVVEAVRCYVERK